MKIVQLSNICCCLYLSNYKKIDKVVDNDVQSKLKSSIQEKLFNDCFQLIRITGKNDHQTSVFKLCSVGML